MFGSIYCISIASMPGILNIGSTTLSPEMLLNEINNYSKWSPLIYKIEIFKNVSEHIKKKVELHKLLTTFDCRINHEQEFFSISLDTAYSFFNLFDGDLWVEQSEDDTDTPKMGCRDMFNCFRDGQRIRHTLLSYNVWIGTYNSRENVIIYDKKKYKSLSGFVRKHYSVVRPDRTSSANGWMECEYEVNGRWTSTFNIKH
jgi:hypothetical protein